MGIGLLPWEKWLPPWVYGPLVFVASIWALFFSSFELEWWQYILWSAGAIYGGWGTLAWLMHKRNIFNGESKSDPNSDAKPPN